MRKNIKRIGLLVIAAIFLVGCGDNDDTVNQTPVETEPGQQNENSNANGTGDTNDDSSTAPDSEGNDVKPDTNTNDGTADEPPYSFIDLEIDIEHSGDYDLEVDYEFKRSGFDVSYERESLNIDLDDAAAMAELEPIFDTFTFDETTSEGEILTEILNGFTINQYDEIDIEVTFQDGTKIKIER